MSTCLHPYAHLHTMPNTAHRLLCGICGTSLAMPPLLPSPWERPKFTVAHYEHILNVYDFQRVDDENDPDISYDEIDDDVVYEPTGEVWAIRIMPDRVKLVRIPPAPEGEGRQGVITDYGNDWVQALVNTLRQFLPPAS